MALPDILLTRLIQTVKEQKLKGRFLMLGRQTWMGSRRDRSAELFQEILSEHMPGVSEEELKNPDDAYCETFFKTLGFSKVDSMDFSDFEGASIVQDLSGTIKPSLKGKFDVIYDGGTCEHIFDLPTAYANIDLLLKPEGVLIGHSPCNNWINHSFYQINPEMVYGYWERAMGYEILHLSLQPVLPAMADRVATTTNPNETGKRPRIQGRLPNNSPIILNYVVRKPKRRKAQKGGVYQSDYAARWAE